MALFGKKSALPAPTPLEQLRSDIPAAVRAVAARMMAKDPDGRIQTPGEVADLLEPFAQPVESPVERDFNRKSTRGRKRLARFMEDHSGTSISTAAIPTLAKGNPVDSKAHSHLAGHTVAGQHGPAEAGPMPAAPPTKISTFTDDEVLPVFDADFDLPRAAVGVTVDAKTHLPQ